MPSLVTALSAARIRTRLPNAISTREHLVLDSHRIITDMAKRKIDGVETVSEAPTTKAAKMQPTKTQRQDDKELVERVNTMSAMDFCSDYIDDSWLRYAVNGPGDAVNAYEIALKSSKAMSPVEMSSCLSLVESTSRQDYENSSWGWRPRRKRREMREPEMWYLLVSMVHDIAQPANHSIDGFLSFMITHDSDPPVPALYIYEIHLAERLRKVGLGAHLMQSAEKIAEKIGLQKVMLTCFLSNAKALGFYKKRGYAADACSPEARRTRSKVVEPDYVIMSRPAKATAAYVPG